MTSSTKTSILYALFAALVMAAISTLGDFIWAKWIPTHRTSLGMIHGAVVCLCIGGLLGGYLGSAAAIARVAAGSLGVGLVAAGSFYLLFSAIGWAAMFAAWMVLWILTALLLRQVGKTGESAGRTLGRGALAAILSGLAFYAISGIWLDPPPDGPDYPVNFASWLIAFIPGFLPLLFKLPRGAAPTPS